MAGNQNFPEEGLVLEGSPHPEVNQEERVELRHVESKEDMFEDATDDIDSQETQSHDNSNGNDDSPDRASDASEDKLRALLEEAIRDKERVASAFKEERDAFLKEVGILRRQLKALVGEQLVPGDDESEETVACDALPHETLSKCLQFVGAAVEERVRSENRIIELQQQIEDLNLKVQLEQNVEIVADRMLGSLGLVVAQQEELSDYSVMGKISYVERSTSMLLDQYNWFLYETDQLFQCLSEGGVKVEVQEGFGPVSIFAAVRTELQEMKNKDAQIAERLNHLEEENRRLVEEIERGKAMADTVNMELGKVKVELEQEKNRFSNTKEKLSIAVTKGKALVQQRESLKQSLAEKTSELEKCLVELQEKSGIAEAAESCKAELVKCETLVISLQEALTERNTLLASIEQVLSLTSVLKEVQAMNIVEKVKWIVNLVQQRESLEQSLAEKTSELEKCAIELQEKSGIAEAAESCKAELVKCETLVISLQEALTERNRLLASIEQVLSLTSVLKEVQAMNIVEKVKWIVNVVLSQEELHSQKDAILEDLQEIFAHADVPEELKSTNIAERSKWLVNLVASLQEVLSQRNTTIEQLEDLFSEINIPAELQLTDIVGSMRWLVEERNVLKDNLLEFHRLKDALSLVDLPEIASSSDLETRIGWLKESVHKAKAEIHMLQDEIVRTKEAAHNEIDRLSTSLLAESQEKEYIKSDMDELMHRYEGVTQMAHQASSEKDQMIRMLLEASGMITDSQEGVYHDYSDLSMLIHRCIGKIKKETSASLDMSPAMFKAFERMQTLFYVQDQELKLCMKILDDDIVVRFEMSNLSNNLSVASQELAALKEKKESLERDLDRSEEKSALLREKLSLAVKKGKGLFQDRENLKLLLDEKNSEIDKLKVELRQLESTIVDCKDQINTLSADAEKIPKLEVDYIAIKGQRNQLEQFLLESNNMLQRVIESVEQIGLPSDSAFNEPVEKVIWLADYVKKCELDKTEAVQELEKAKEEISDIGSKLAEAQTSMKLLENQLLVSVGHIAQLEEEKREIQDAQRNVEQDLERAVEEGRVLAKNLSNASTARKSLEDALALAEDNISLLIKEREENKMFQISTSDELEKLKEEFGTQSSRLSEALQTKKSLEVALSQAEAGVSLLTEQNNNVVIGRTALADELKKLKDESGFQASKLSEATKTIKTLEDALSKAMSDISTLEDGKRIAEQEISTLNSKLDACMHELDGTHGSLQSRSVELAQHLGDLELLLENEGLLSTIRQCFEKEFENLKSMDVILKDIRDHIVDTGLDVLLSHPVMEDDSEIKPFPHDPGNIVKTEMVNGETTKADVDNISFHFKKTVDSFQLRNKLLADSIEGFHIFINELIEDLLRRLSSSKHAVMILLEHMKSMKEKMKNMDMRTVEQEKTIASLENDIRILESACTNATRELQFEVKNNLAGLRTIPELQELSQSLTPGLNAVSRENKMEELEDTIHVKMADKLSSSTRNVQALTLLFECTSNVVAKAIEDLRRELKESEKHSEKTIEERDELQNRVSEMENDVQALQNSCEELRLRISDYQAIEDKLKEKETELSTVHDHLQMQEQEAKDSLMPAGELKALFDKTRGVEISSEELEVGDVQAFSSVDVKKLFYIVDSVSELRHKIDVLTNDRSELLSTLAEKDLQIEDLKENTNEQIRNNDEYEKIKSEISEIKIGLQKICDLLGGNGIVGDHKSAGTKVFLLALEKQIQALLMEVEKSKSQTKELHNKLLGSQKEVDELAVKIKFLDGSLQSRAAQQEIVQERSIFEAPSMPTGSEISEVDDGGLVAKSLISSGPSAAHARTMQKGSSDHLTLNIDSETSSLINNEETDEEKGHVFKSLNTSGLIPKQGKSLADRIDGLWVSGGRVLMSRPRARVGLIAYCLLLHMWLLATIL